MEDKEKNESIWQTDPIDELKRQVKELQEQVNSLAIEVGQGLPNGLASAIDTKVSENGGRYFSAQSGARTLIFPDVNTGIQCIDDAAADVFKVIVGGTNVGDVIIGNYAGNQGLFYDKSLGTFTFRGAITAPSGTIGGWNINATSIYTGTEDHSGYTANAGDITIYSDGADASIHAKNFYIDSAGVLNCTGAVISGAITAAAGSVIAASYLTGEIGQTNLNVATRGWVQTSAFSLNGGTPATQVDWGAGTFTSADGTAYSIGAGNTGVMSAKTYIYLDTAVSLTAYQKTTTAATAVGAGKVLVAIAQNGTGEATYKVLQGQGGENLDGANLVLGSVTANELAASLVYAGAITIDTAGLIKSGQTAYDTGTGWWIGNVTGTPKLSIGNAAGNKMTWDGTTLKVVGDINAGSAYVATAGETLAAGDAVFAADGTQAITRIVSVGDGAAGHGGSQTIFGMVAGSGTIKAAQKFVATHTETVTKIKVWLMNENVPTDSVTCGIQGDSGGYPDGSYISSADIAASSMTGSYVEYTFTISAALTASTTYHIVLQRTGSLNNTNQYSIETSTDNPYASGNSEIYTGASPAWAAGTSGYDRMFKIFGALSTAGNVLKTCAAITGFYETFIGFAKTAIAAGATGSVEVGGFTSSLSGLTIGKSYYLSDTFGVISTSAGTNTRKVGISISATSLILTNLW